MVLLLPAIVMLLCYSYGKAPHNAVLLNPKPKTLTGELGVQAPVGFWDPLGLSADGDAWGPGGF